MTAKKSWHHRRVAFVANGEDGRRINLINAKMRLRARREYNVDADCTSITYEGDVTGHWQAIQKFYPQMAEMYLVGALVAETDGTISWVEELTFGNSHSAAATEEHISHE